MTKPLYRIRNGMFIFFDGAFVRMSVDQAHWWNVGLGTALAAAFVYLIARDIP